MGDRFAGESIAHGRNQATRRTRIARELEREPTPLRPASRLWACLGRLFSSLFLVVKRHAQNKRVRGYRLVIVRNAQLIGASS
jgi:hypothetical protein